VHSFINWYARTRIRNEIEEEQKVGAEIDDEIDMMNYNKFPVGYICPVLLCGR
jgi:hypothetical protein